MLAQSLTSELLKDKNVRPVDLIQFLTYSGFNPPPENEKLNGDLFYLHLKTLEGLDYHITACEIGFYVNQSKISNFNPAMNSAKLVFASLLDLIANVSDRYFDNMQKFLADNVLTVADYERQKLSLTFGKKVTQNQSKWLADCEH